MCGDVPAGGEWEEAGGLYGERDERRMVPGGSERATSAGGYIPEHRESGSDSALGQHWNQRFYRLRGKNGGVAARAGGGNEYFATPTRQPHNFLQPFGRYLCMGLR